MGLIEMPNLPGRVFNEFGDRGIGHSLQFQSDIIDTHSYWSNLIYDCDLDVVPTN